MRVIQRRPRASRTCSTSKPVTAAALSGRKVTGSISTPSRPDRLARHAASRSCSVRTGRAWARLPVAGLGFHQPPDQRRDQHGIVGVLADVGDAHLDGRVVLGQPGVEVHHAGIQQCPGVDHLPYRGLVRFCRPELAGRAGTRPAAPRLVAEARVGAVHALPERGVGAQRQQRRQPRLDPVEHGDALFGRRDPDVHVAPAGELFVRGQPEGHGHRLVAARRHDLRMHCHRRGAERGNGNARPGGRGRGRGPAPAQFAAELVERVAGPGVDLQLLLLQLEFERLHRVRLARRGLISTGLARARLRRAPAGRPDDGAGQGPWAAGAGLDDQEFFLHPDAAHGSPFR